MVFYILIYLFPFTLTFQEAYTIGGRGIIFYHFIAIVLYSFFVKTGNWKKVLNTKMAFFIFLFLLLLTFWESVHPHSSYFHIVRMSVMFLGAVGLSTLLDNPSRVNHLLTSMMLTAGFFLLSSVILGFDQLGKDSESIDSFKFLNEFFGSTKNPNDIGAMIAFLASVVIVLIEREGLTKSFALKPIRPLLVIGAFLAFYLLDSRTGIMLTLVIVSLFFLYFRKAKKKHFIVMSLVGLLLVFRFAEFVQDRFLVYFDSDQDFQEIDGRSRVYFTFFETLPQTILTGVGNGNFESKWGYQTEFAQTSGSSGKAKVQSAHNVYFQLIIIGGVSTLAIFVMMVIRIVKKLPGRESNRILDYKIFCFATAMLLLMFFSHNIEAKEFSILFSIFLSRNILWA